MRIPSLRVLAVAAAMASAVAARVDSTAQTPSATDVAGRIQAHYDSVQDFRADFVQSHKGPFLRQVLTEKGKLVVKKPKRLRVSYTSRPKKEFVADGTTFYAYFAEDKFGTESPLTDAADSSIALLFLAGRGHLQRDFTPSLPADQPAGQWKLVLQPKSGQADFDTLTLVVDRKTFALASLVTDDNDSGTTTFEFSDWRENTGVSDKEFAFSWPRGTTIRR